MNYKLFFLAIVTAAAFSSCGADMNDDTVITGSVAIDATMPRTFGAPAFVAVASTSDIEAIKNDPTGTIITILSPRPDGTFTIECKNFGLFAGDEIFIFAFIDNDYRSGIPLPTPGDAVGFYTNGFRLYYIIGEDGNADILINRQHYDFDASIIGIIEGNESGTVILIAYSGDFNSSNVSDIDSSEVIGYTRFTKPAHTAYFRLPVMPYGQDIPISGVYIIALLDANNNGIPDEGDTIGFAFEAGNNIPAAVTVVEGVVAVPSIRFVMKVYGEPAHNEPPLTLSGQFNLPDGHGSDDAGTPLFLVAAKGSDPNEVFANITNLSINTFDFVRINSHAPFALTLSRRKFNPADTVFVIALWDKDYAGGFPRATQGDTLGFVMNKGNVEYTVTLQEGNNTLIHDGTAYRFNEAGGYSFALDRNVYRHNAVMRFQLQQGDAADSEFINGASVICAAVYETNEDIIQAIAAGQYTLDIDKVVAVTKAVITMENNSDTTVYYSMPVMPALHQSIPAMRNGELYLDNIWAIGILDANNNGKPDDGEKVGIFCIKVTLPIQMTQEQILHAVQSFLFQAFAISVTKEEIQLILEQFPVAVNGETIEAFIPSKLLSPVSNGIYYFPYSIRFFNVTYQQ